jgi:cation:H+ antiporter
VLDRVLIERLVLVGVRRAVGTRAVVWWRWGGDDEQLTVARTAALTTGPVGATFVALATTAELFALVWAAARRDVDQLAVAGIVGSAVYNATVTLGLPALWGPLDATGLAGPAWIAAALPLGILGLGGAGGRVGRAAGAGLVAVYVGYVVVLLSG